MAIDRKKAMENYYRMKLEIAKRGMKIVERKTFWCIRFRKKTWSVYPKSEFTKSEAILCEAQARLGEVLGSTGRYRKKRNV